MKFIIDIDLGFAILSRIPEIKLHRAQERFIQTVFILGLTREPLEQSLNI